MPIAIILIALAAAYTTIFIDQSMADQPFFSMLPGYGRLTVDGARQMVASVAGSTITVASLVFSLTFVALTLMSQQFGPRIVLVFMNDHLTKFVIGAFAGTFLYSLIILGAVGIGQGGEVASGSSELFVPRLSVYTVGLLGIFSFILIIIFVHHMAISIQADAIVARLGDELDRAIRDTLLAKTDEAEREAEDDDTEDTWQEDIARLEKKGREVPVDRSGYVQVIGYDKLVKAASAHGVSIMLICRPGDFVVEGIPVAVIGGKSDDSDDLTEAILDAIELGGRRTQAQSAEYEASALVEVALRALSPGINDPFTAIACIDHLTDSLGNLLRREIKPAILRDDDGQARLYRQPQAFIHFLDMSFHAIRQSARHNLQTLVQMAKSLQVLAELARTDKHRAALLVHVKALKDDCLREVDNRADEKYILGHFDQVAKTLLARQVKNTKTRKTGT